MLYADQLRHLRQQESHHPYIRERHRPQMTQRYSHVSSWHLEAAQERLVQKLTENCAFHSWHLQMVCARPIVPSCDLCVHEFGSYAIHLIRHLGTHCRPICGLDPKRRSAFQLWSNSHLRKGLPISFRRPNRWGNILSVPAPALISITHNRSHKKRQRNNGALQRCIHHFL